MRSQTSWAGLENPEVIEGRCIYKPSGHDLVTDALILEICIGI